MTINPTKIYKHQYLINIAESAEWPADDQPPESLLSIPFLNPHENHVITSSVNIDFPYFIAYSYCLSKHPHDDAVKMLEQEPYLVNLYGLITNPNPKIMPLLEQYIEQFEPYHWGKMCQSNHKVILEFLEKHTDKIDNYNWQRVSGNKHEIAIRILQNNPHKINFKILSGNPFGIEIMKQHMDLIDWEYFSHNSHPDAIQIIEQNLDRVSRSGLSQNPSAFHILLENPHLIDFNSLLYNPSASAIAYIEANATQINNSHVPYLVNNPNGLSLIEKMLKQGQITQEAVLESYTELLTHPALFDVDLDYQELSKERSKIIYNELLEKAFHPSRVSRWLDYHCENGGTPEDFEM
jgi:hypothetical protein